MATGRNYKKIQKLSEQLAKSPSLKLKDLTKFLDTIAANIDDCFDLDLFDFAARARIEQDEEGIVKYLIDVISTEGLAKKVIALEIVYNLISDGPTREKFLAHRMLLILISLLPTVTVNQNPADRLKEALAVQVLRVIRYLAENHNAFITPNEEITTVVQALVTLANRTQTTNEQLQCAIGAAIMPFYLHGGFNKGDTWNGAPNKYMLVAVQAGKARIHREISPNEVALEKEIFQSPLCKVFRGTWEGHQVAVKKFSQYSLGFSWEDFYKEVGLLSIAQHPHVVKRVSLLFHNISMDRSKTTRSAFANNGHTEEPFIVLEYLAKGDLHEYVEATFKQSGGFTYGQLVSIATDIAKGLAYLHQLGIIHRDIKTSNFLVADDGTVQLDFRANVSVKMIDFGVSRIMSTSVIMTTVGTPAFMAPEVIDGKMYTEMADVYSFAMVMYECLTGKEPFADVQSLQLAGKVLEGLRPPIPANTPFTVYVAIMTQCWSANPAERLGFTQVLVRLFQLKRQVQADEQQGIFVTAAGAAATGNPSALARSGNMPATSSTAKPAAATTSTSGRPIQQSSPTPMPNARPAQQPPASMAAASRSSTALSSSASTSMMSLPAPVMSNDDTVGRKAASSVDPRDYDWYFGQLPKETAVDLLMGKPVGTFLVRSSSREGCYAASVVFQDGVRHILIQPGANGRYVVDALDNKNYNFRSIPAVVKSYSNLMQIPCQRPDSGGTYTVAPPFRDGPPYD